MYKYTSQTAQVKQNPKEVSQTLKQPVNDKLNGQDFLCQQFKAWPQQPEKIKRESGVYLEKLSNRNINGGKSLGLSLMLNRVELAPCFCNIWEAFYVNKY